MTRRRRQGRAASRDPARAARPAPRASLYPRTAGPAGRPPATTAQVAETQTTPLFFKKLLSAIDEAIRDEGEKLGKRLPVVKSTLRLLERVTVLGEALGWHRPPIMRLLLRKLIDVVEQPGVPAAVGAGNPARAPRLGGRPTSPVPARWDEALERLSMAEKPTEFGVHAAPTRESEVYWAALFLSIAAYQARVRTSTRLKEKIRHV